MKLLTKAQCAPQPIMVRGVNTKMKTKRVSTKTNLGSFYGPRKMWPILMLFELLIYQIFNESDMTANGEIICRHFHLPRRRALELTGDLNLIKSCMRENS